MFYFSFHNFTQKLNCLQGLNFRAKKQDLHPKFWNSKPKEYCGREAPGQTILPFYGEFGFLKRRSTRTNALWILWYFGKSDWCISWIFYCETIAEIHGFSPVTDWKVSWYSCNQQTNIKIFSRDQLTNFAIFTKTNRWILRFFSHDRSTKLNSPPPSNRSTNFMIFVFLAIDWQILLFFL